MIINKYFDINGSSIALTSKILTIAKDKKSLSIDEAFQLAKNDFERYSLDQFQEAISYLFLLGLVDYNPDNDSMEYVNEN